MREVCRKGSKEGEVEDKKYPETAVKGETQSPVGKIHIPHVGGKMIPLLQ